jgi:N,N'-diacetylchitobiose transport system permease protein
MATTAPTRTAGRPPGAPRPHAWWSGRRFEYRVLPWLLLAPALVVVIGLVLYPVVNTIWLSFTDARLLSRSPAEFVGLDNYREVLTDPDMRAVFVRTVVFGFACVIGTMLLGFAVALLLNLSFRGKHLLSVLVILPWAMPAVASGVVWSWLFNDQTGIVNWALTSLGLERFEGYAWFNEQLPAFFAMGLTVVWQSFPFIAVSLLAGLQAIPPDLIDAAKVDGASAWQRLWRIRLPLLRPLIAILLVISTIWDFKIFDQIKVMTDGGPARTTETVALAVYREGIAQRHIDTGSTLAVVLFLLLVVISVLHIRMVGREGVEG